jgi:CHAD domain-containing protein
MKARRINLYASHDAAAAMRRVASVRFAEALVLASALREGRPEELHALRIACKRLRYALERFSAAEPALGDAAARLAHVQSALGDIHDRDVLLAMLPHSARTTTHRLRVQRSDALVRARTMWHDAFTALGPFEGLVRFVERD